MTEPPRIYPCNREYEKTIKFNGRWYKLKSLFDADIHASEFDFNNTELNDQNIYNSEVQDIFGE